MEQLKQKAKHDENEEKGGRGRGRGRGKGRGRGRSQAAYKRPSAKKAEKVDKVDKAYENWAAWGTDDDWKVANEVGWDDESWAWDSNAWWESECGKWYLAQYEQNQPSGKSKQPTKATKNKKNEDSEAAGKQQKKRKTKEKEEEEEPPTATASAEPPKKERKRKNNHPDETGGKTKAKREPKSQAAKKQRRQANEPGDGCAKKAFPKNDKQLSTEINTFLNEVSEVEDDNVRTELRSKLSEQKDCQLSVYWTRPAVGVRIKSTTKDLAYVSFSFTSNDPDVPKKLVVGATLIVADLLATHQHS